MSQHEQEHGEFRALAGLLSKFLSNDVPHLQRAIGKLEGRVLMMMWGLGLLGTLTTGVLIRLLIE